MNTKIIKGTHYTAFTIEKASEGGISQKDAIALLHENGISAKTGCYSPYVGHYGLWVETKHTDKAEELLFR
jgi:hypothetical protein